MRLNLAIAAIASLGAAQPVAAASVTASVNASANKPLLLAKVQDLDLGSVMLGPGVWSNATVALSQLGVLVCLPVNITCSGTTQVARYNVQGSNQQIVRVSVPNVTMTNQSDSSKTLLLTTDKPLTVVLTNSGAPGTDFSIGGSVTLSSSTATGTYVGTFNVTADYQ